MLETDLQVPGATYYFDAWYVVRDDVNIFNGMAYRQVTPTFNGSSWSFGPLSAQRAGAAVDAWVSPTAPGLNADNKKLNTGQGQLTLAAKATDVGGGRWRYDYALMNHDFDNGVASFSIPLPAGAVVTNTWFHDADRNPATDWIPSVTPGEIRFLPPSSAFTPKKYFLDWGMLYSFSFEVNKAPTPAGGSMATLGASEGSTRTHLVSTLGPGK